MKACMSQCYLATTVHILNPFNNTTKVNYTSNGFIKLIILRLVLTLYQLFLDMHHYYKYIY